MRMGRSLPPAAAPIGWADLGHGVIGAFAARASVKARQQEVRDAFGVAHVFPVSSGKAALQLALSVLKTLSPRTEVVIPAYTCFSVPAAILKAGLRPVLCDIDPSTFDFDHGQLEQILTHDTLSVVSHHLFGIPSDIERTRAICSARGIFVIEDAAQALDIGAGRAAGTVGDLGIFSFGRGKNITCGSGGMIVTNSDRIAAAIDESYHRLPSPSIGATLKDLAALVFMIVFIRPRLYWIPAALPFLRLGTTEFPRTIAVRRLSGFKAGLLRNWRRHLMRSNQVRSAAAADLRRRLHIRSSSDPMRPLLRLPILASNAREKQRLYLASQARGLGISVAYPSSIDAIPEIRRTIGGRIFPCATNVASRLVTLPTHQWLLERDRQALADLWQDCRSA
jgi:DegT/DnrJ/EryC1/StrS aminotransferase family protein